MCHKQGWDGSGHYSVCPETPDRENPVVRGDASFIAAICMDTQNHPRWKDIAIRASNAKKKNNFVCIPAAMSTLSWFDRGVCQSNQNFLKKELSGNGRLILANSDENGPSSFITGPDWTVIECIRGDHNVDRLLLDTLQ